MQLKLDLAALAALLMATAFVPCAKAQQAGQPAAAPADRCEGTLCDLYYGGPKPAAAPGAQPAAAQPLMVPRPTLFGGPSQGTGAPAGRPLVGVGGGGLASMSRGEPQERCEGTLCDLYYGGPKPEKPAASATPTSGAAAAPVAVATDPDAEPEPGVVHGRMVESREAPPRCVNKQDPWKCYR